MSFIQLDFFSETLQLASSMNVLLPRTTQAQRDKLGADHRYPVLYLLHGMSDDHTAWTRYTSLERYTRYLNLAVIMPAVHRTSYTNMHQGGRYWTFISQEVPALAHSLFPISTKRAETFTAGLSMGGYGAFKLALRQPERFSYAASLSGAVDMAQRVANPDPSRVEENFRIFGGYDNLLGSDNDLMHLATQVAASGGPKPALYQCCGTEDFLYENNLRFRDHIQPLGYDYIYEEGPGEHEWGYWDQQIQRVLAWLPIKGIDD
ncbi:MAG: alpha/beta hydrolase family protein [Caldilineaceae bacterium]